MTAGPRGGMDVEPPGSMPLGDALAAFLPDFLPDLGKRRERYLELARQLAQAVPSPRAIDVRLAPPADLRLEVGGTAVSVTFDGDKLTICDLDAPALTGGVADATRDAAEMRAISRLLRAIERSVAEAFDQGIASGRARLWCRAGSPLSRFTPLARDQWAHFRVVDVERGVARSEGGDAIFSLRVELLGSPYAAGVRAMIAPHRVGAPGHRLRNDAITRGAAEAARLIRTRNGRFHGLQAAVIRKISDWADERLADDEEPVSATTLKNWASASIKIALAQEMATDINSFLPQIQ